MSQYKPFFLRDQRIKNNCLDLIKELPTDDKNPLVVKIQPITRNLEQNAKFHAMCQDVANQAEFMGRKLTMEQWKVL
ncbi:TPA: recombination protein NinB, partial [Haemophilus influenzae]